MKEEFYKGLGDVIYWSITSKGLESFRTHYNGEFIFYVLSRLETGPASTRELYTFLPKDLRSSIEGLLGNLALLENWGFIEKEIRWEDG